VKFAVRRRLEKSTNALDGIELYRRGFKTSVFPYPVEIQQNSHKVFSFLLLVNLKFLEVGVSSV